MRRFRIALVAAICALSACAPARLSSPDGLALGAPHPLLQRPAPDYAPETHLYGRAIDPKTFEGKVVVVHFWATWADASRATLPKLQGLYERYKDRGVEVVAVSVDDDRSAVGEMIASAGVVFPVAWDPHKDVAGRWFVRSVPASFVIDRRGVVRAAFVRYDDGVDVEIETDVKILTGDSTGLARRAP